MSTKKSFSISANLASGLRTSIQSAAAHHGQLHYDMMPLDIIDPDPHNPRKFFISRLDIMNGLNKSDPDYEHKLKEWNELLELSDSIKKVGVRNAIEVYKEGTKYRIISGERRFLASLLAGQKYIPARINQKFDEFKLRYIQWIENINRQDLSLWEKYNNLLTIETAYQKTHAVEMNLAILKEMLGVSDTQAYRYFCLLKADSEIIDLVKSGKLINLKIIQEIVSIKNKSARQEMIQKLTTSQDTFTSLKNFKIKKSQSTSKVINLGKLKNKHTAQYIHKILTDNVDLNINLTEVDWASFKAINKAFKLLFQQIEKELATKEKANEI